MLLMLSAAPFKKELPGSTVKRLLYYKRRSGPVGMR